MGKDTKTTPSDQKINSKQERNTELVIMFKIRQRLLTERNFQRIGGWVRELTGKLQGVYTEKRDKFYQDQWASDQELNSSYWKRPRLLMSSIKCSKHREKQYSLIRRIANLQMKTKVFWRTQGRLTVLRTWTILFAQQKIVSPRQTQSWQCFTTIASPYTCRSS